MRRPDALIGFNHREALATRIVRELREKILSGDMKPGDRMPSEQGLMDTYSVSRAVVREAISSLKAEGLMTTQQGVGAFVLQPRSAEGFQVQQADLSTVGEVLNMLELRISVETEAAALAARRRTAAQLAGIGAAYGWMEKSIADGSDAVEPDFQFHLRIAQATGNRFFSEFFGYLGVMLIPRARVNTMGQTDEQRRAYLSRANVEHEEIYSAIEARDAEAARAAMRLHLTKSRDRLRASQENRAQSS